MATTPEGKIKTAIKRWLVDHGAWYFMPVSNGMGAMGVPDFIVCYDGKFLGIEAKAPGKRGNTTPAQKRQLDGINKANGIAIVVDDVAQLDKLAEGLERLRYGTC